MLRYRGHTYEIRDGAWRGPDGHMVHLLTWVTDDLLRRYPDAGAKPGDMELAAQVAARLGDEAQVVGEA